MQSTYKNYAPFNYYMNVSMQHLIDVIEIVQKSSQGAEIRVVVL